MVLPFLHFLERIHSVNLLHVRVACPIGRLPVRGRFDQARGASEKRVARKIEKRAEGKRGKTPGGAENIAGIIRKIQIRGGAEKIRRGAESNCEEELLRKLRGQQLNHNYCEKQQNRAYSNWRRLEQLVKRRKINEHLQVEKIRVQLKLPLTILQKGRHLRVRLLFEPRMAP